MIIVLTGIFEYFNDRSWLSGPLKSMVISILLKIGTVKILKNLHIVLIVKKQIFQIKLLNHINFFPIKIFIFIQFTVFIHSPCKFIWFTDIQNALLLVFDHHNALQLITVQLG